MSNLVKYKSPIEYSFYQWIVDYPTSEEWKERILKEPSVKGCPNLELFFKFVKTIMRQGNAKNWKNWDFIRKKILYIKPNFDQGELIILKKMFQNLIEFYKTPAFKKGIHMDPNINIRSGYCLEKSVENGKFYEKEVPMIIP